MQRSADDVAATLAQRFGQPEPTAGEWRRHYTPEDGDAYAAELADLDAQLDVGWSGWRARTPFRNLDPDKVAWIKSRLLRRELILQGKGRWGVRITFRTSGEERFPYAQPVRPRHAELLPDAFRPLVAVPVLAQRAGLPSAQVAELLTRLPAGVRDVRSWLVGEVSRTTATLPGSAASAPLQAAPGDGAAAAHLPDQPHADASQVPR